MHKTIISLYPAAKDKVFDAFRVAGIAIDYVDDVTKDMEPDKRKEECENMAKRIAQYIGGVSEGRTVVISPKAKARFLKKKTDEVAYLVKRSSEKFTEDSVNASTWDFYYTISTAFLDPYLFLAGPDIYATNLYEMLTYANEDKDFTMTVEELFNCHY